MKGNVFDLTVIFCGHSYKYELESVLKLFIPATRFSFVYDGENALSIDGDRIIAEKRVDKDAVYFSVLCFIGDSRESETKLVDKCDMPDDGGEFILSKLLFKAMCRITGIIPEWGVITGVRPVKRVNEMLSQGFSQSEIKTRLINDFYVSDNKADIALRTAYAQRDILKSTNEKAFDLYISIPFCPTRCSYCSFVSQSIEKASDQIGEYVKNLLVEIEYTANIIKRTGLILDTVYIGGGTPTTLSADMLRIVMTKISECFDMSHIREFTVEAGRADTITEDKLITIKDCGANRISINPQTLSDSVLKAIGRRHTVDDFYNSFFLARKVGFDMINTDLIAGLPTDTVDSFKRTINGIIELAPENITVHTLSVKRASNINLNSQLDVLKNPAGEMVEYATKTLSENGYSPYYLYRQKNMVGNLENIGWEKGGTQSLYNIYIMEESKTVIALGAGASTKLVDRNGKRLERIFNYKYAVDYNNNFDLMLKKKDEIERFYVNA